MSSRADRARRGASEHEGASRPDVPGEVNRTRIVLQHILASSPLTIVFAVLAALLVSAVLIAATSAEVAAALPYVARRPLDLVVAVRDSVGGAYGALFRGAVFNSRQDGLAAQLKPLTESMSFATPLIMAGLGVALAFRAGLFNIGGRGQMLIGAACAGWVGFTFELPMAIHLPLALLAGIAGGALWGGLVGFLKARTGASEVILTIMLNYVAFYLVSYGLRTVLRNPESNNPKSPPIHESAELFPLLGSGYSLHVGFLVAVAAAFGCWWLIERSSLGFQFRAVGLNPHASHAAGMRIGRLYTWAMVLAGGLIGLAGANQALGISHAGFGSGIDAGIGFEAITVALLGRSRPWGVLAAGLLFGAFKAGGYSMQASQGIPVDIVLVVQSLIVLFIAAPALIRGLLRIPAPGTLVGASNGQGGAA